MISTFEGGDCNVTNDMIVHCHFAVISSGSLLRSVFKLLELGRLDNMGVSFGSV